ncbi:MAG: MBOAT family protein [Caldilineaceae bacterium]|nr:MBOAT family protein [Caldilineaceae bacterium]
MLFNSLEFVIFFPTVVAIYFLLPQRYRWLLLLLASYYFYAAWKIEYTLLIFTSTVVDYTMARRMAQSTQPGQRRAYLIVSLLVNLGLLFGFKYFSFFNESVRATLNLFNVFYNVPAFQVLLPVGISFYTFQTLSYVIDVYRGKIEPERHFGIYALYVSFFPQLVAGPIERATHLLPQFRQQMTFDQARVASGLRLILWGLFKKVVIADRLAIYVNQVYNNPSEQGALTLLIASYFFAFQIYCDFSGYSDIAIGVARVLGFDLMQNFRQPYMARSLSSFWRRWHISLSTWFRDYLYIPLGGNRVPQWRWYSNLFIVFLVSGLWHGAAWHFVIWGALHGILVVLEAALSNRALWGARWLRRDEPLRLPAIVNIFATFHVVLLTWIFFRANSLPDALLILGRLFTFAGTNTWDAINAPWTAVGVDPVWEMSLAVGLIILLEVIQWLERWGQNMERTFVTYSRPVRWAAYLFLAIATMNLGTSMDTPFIYFQF